MLLHARGLVVRHHPMHPPVLAGVDLDIAAGELVAIVGANGSGKSTLARALAGLVPLEAGHIGSASGGHVRVGLVLQDPAAQLVCMTVADEIALGPEAAGVSAERVAATVLRLVDLHGLGALVHRDPSTLSGGQQQRVAVAAIEACEVDVLVLDEPTALLDLHARARCLDTIRQASQGRAAVWITQESDEVAACDRVVVLDAGEVVWGGAVHDYLHQTELVASIGLQLPCAARVAHRLAADGLIARADRMPATAAELIELLGAGRRGG